MTDIRGRRKRSRARAAESENAAAPKYDDIPVLLGNPVISRPGSAPAPWRTDGGPSGSVGAGIGFARRRGLASLGAGNWVRSAPGASGDAEPHGDAHLRTKGDRRVRSAAAHGSDGADRRERPDPIRPRGRSGRAVRPTGWRGQRNGDIPRFRSGLGNLGCQDLPSDRTTIRVSYELERFSLECGGLRRVRHADHPGATASAEDGPHGGPYEDRQTRSKTALDSGIGPPVGGLLDGLSLEHARN